MVPVGAFSVWRRLIDGDDVDAACAQTRCPVPGSGSHLDEGAEAGEGCQGAIVGKDVRIALCEVGEAIGSDVVEQFVEPVVIHAAHRPPFDPAKRLRDTGPDARRGTPYLLRCRRSRRR